MRSFHFQNDALDLHARQLERSADYQVLRRLPRADEMWLAPMPAGGPVTVLATLDLESTGLTASDRPIEIAVVRMGLDHQGALCSIENPVTLWEDPGAPISDAVAALTGITDDDIRGKRFDEEELAAVLSPVDVLVAANATFDAEMMRRRFPSLGHPWACALRDVDWKRTPYGRTQAGLVAAAGFFYTGHRAAIDAWALAVLLATQADDGRTIAAHLVDASKRIDARVSAWNAPYAIRELLRARGYRWNLARRVWRRDLPATEAQAECEALLALSALIRPTVEDVDGYNRHTV